MRCWNGDGPSAKLGINCAERDAEDARRVAGELGIPFYTWDFGDEYKKYVVEYMIEGYRRGITPNPDVMCNREIKFGLFLEKALSVGADYVATGHYVTLCRNSLSGTGVASAPVLRQAQDPELFRGTASARLHPCLPAGRSAPAFGASDSFPKKNFGSSFLELKDILSRNPAAGELGPRRNAGVAVARTSGGRRWSGRSGLRKEYFSLHAAKDKSKDQSYFLWTLTQNQLRYCLFPIGEYLKSEVRAIAREAGLSTAEKKDSQGICFLGKVTLQDFLKQYIPEEEGSVLTTSGKKVGKHSGIYFYTIGQRRGLGISGASPYYIAEKDVLTNTLVVVEGSESASLYRREVAVETVNFIRPAGKKTFPVMARVRYRQPLSKATLSIGEGYTGMLTFEKPQKFVAPGQSAVFYSQSEEMLGGGIIL